MKKKWLISIVLITFLLLSAINSLQVSALGTHFRAHKVIKLQQFEVAQTTVSKSELPLLLLWESMLTGRSAPLSKLTKEKYSDLGLNHIFTPSGFHLSAVLSPLMKLITRKPFQFGLICLLGIGLLFLPGFLALKRMLLIKGLQNITSLHIGFVSALLLDLCLGSFQNNSLSFTYSFLFLGIIYSGLEGVGLVIWFFLGQMIIAFFNGQDISPLLLLFSPLLNFVFALSMPFLLIFSYPLTDIQLAAGLKILGLLQKSVDTFSEWILLFPTIEVSHLTILAATFFIYRKWIWILVLIFLYPHDLNLDLQRRPAYQSSDFKPQGHLISQIQNDRELRIVFSDGSCRVKLVRGFWWESCSPRYKRSRKKKT